MASKDYTNHIVGSAIVIIVILIGVFLIVQKRVPSVVVGGNDTKSEETTQAALALDVANQPAGESVMVTGITVDKVSWIAVREPDGSRVLGAARIDPGTRSVTVSLLRATTAGNRYEVVIYEDDGDRAFDMKKDIVVGNIGPEFTAQ